MKQKLGIVNWIKTYPTKEILFLILFVIPLLFILLFVFNISRKDKSFYFDTDDNDKPLLLYQKDLTKKKKLDEVFDNFEISLEQVENIKNDEKEDVQYGRFKFKTDYTKTSLYKDASISFRYVMTANWFNEQSNPTSSTTIDFPFNLPNRKYLIFKVNKPILYVRSEEHT